MRFLTRPMGYQITPPAPLPMRQCKHPKCLEKFNDERTARYCPAHRNNGARYEREKLRRGNGLDASDYLANLLGIESLPAGLSIKPSQLLLSEAENATPMDLSRPLIVELFAGSFGWSAGALADGWRSVGVDISHEPYHGPVPDQAALILADVSSLHGSIFRNASLIVASPPCQEFSYMAMPWTLAKQKAEHYRSNPKLIDSQLKALFNCCFRIQREACEAAGRHIPMVVENVKGAQPWVGRAAWHFGSFYLWGDVPALMPISFNRALKGTGGSWYGDYQAQKESQDNAIKQGVDWFNQSCTGSISRRFSSRSSARKAASAQIAKIPLPLSRHIARVYYPTGVMVK